MTNSTFSMQIEGPGTLPAELLRRAGEEERAGCFTEATELCERALTEAQRHEEQTLRIEALRRLAVLWHHRGESARARDLCRESCAAARRLGYDLLAAQALNTLGGLDLSTGAFEPARRAFDEALELGRSSRELQARVLQNLGILANIQGQLGEAMARYERSLAAYRECGDQHGCAITYHNLGMVSADRGQFAAAECYFRESRGLAVRLGDQYLQALCLVNLAEVDVARQRFESATQGAEEALAVFDYMHAVAPQADAYRVLGTIYRETGRPALAEARLRTAIELATAAGSLLGEAEASHELAVLYQMMGRNLEALKLLNAAYRLFHRLDARTELLDVGAKVAELKSTYLHVVREWVRSVELNDSSLSEHSERVARHAVAVARALGLDDEQETTILLGAYLHDIGKLRTRGEAGAARAHPLWGVAMLDEIEFPWDLKSVIRWHHERCDGSGYPDGLRGDAVPLAAQIVGIADYYDALTVGQGGQPALTEGEAIERLVACRAWWSERVVAAFLEIAAPHTHSRAS